MWDIITFGSATQDIYLKSKGFKVVAGKLRLPLDTKVKTEEIIFTSGGGGTNVAATLANFGYKVAYCGMLGDDYFARLILEELKKFKIDASLVKKTKAKPSNVSVILSYVGGEKTILVYRGASDSLKLKDIPFSKIKKVKWLYLAPFAAEMANLTLDLINFAKKHKIKVALNPGYNQLVLPQKVLKEILAKVDVLFLNHKEAALLTGITDSEVGVVFKKLAEQVKGILVMTRGGQGVMVSDGDHLYQAKSLKVKTVDTTGAGDSFAAGFLVEYMKHKDIIPAIQLGMANAASCLKELGAKNGLLKKNQKWSKVVVKKELI